MRTTACPNATFTAALVGGDGSSIGSGTVASDGTFTVDWTQSVATTGDPASEVVLTFSCGASGTLRCYGKPGDTGLTCDAVSDGVLSAIEHAIGQELSSSSDFKGLTVAKLAQGMGETLRLIAALNPSQNFAANLANSTSPADAASILAASPVAGLFQTIQTFISATAASNQAGSNAATALQAIWTPQAVIEMLAALGLHVNVNFDDKGGGPTLYNTLGQVIDQMTGGTFMADTAKYTGSLYTKLYGPNPDTSPAFTLVCSARNENNWSQGAVTYPPDTIGTLSDNTTPKLTCLGATAQSLGVADNQGQLSDNYDLEAYVSSSFSEADRNDPDGTHANTNSVNLSVSLVDIFPEFQTAISPGGLCASFVDNSGDNGPGPNTDFTGLATCIKSHNLDQYFSGALGIGRSLVDPTVQAVKLSLQDIYHALTSTMEVRLTAQTSYGNQGVNVTLTDASSNNNNNNNNSQTYLPLMLTDTQTKTNDYYVFNEVCPSTLCTNQTLNSTPSLSTAAVQSLIDAAAPSFNPLLATLTTIPQFTTVRDWIYNSGHHVDYNTSGQQFFPLAGKDIDGDGNADVPILCAIMDSQSNLALRHLAGSTHIHCEIAANTWSNGVQTTPSSGAQANKDYTGWYGLQATGDFNNGRYFRLIDLFSGQGYQQGGQDLRVRDISGESAPKDSANAAVSSDATTVYGAQLSMCNTAPGSTSAGPSNTFCFTDQFNFVALTFPNLNSDSSVSSQASYYAAQSYFPYQVQQQITVIDINGNSQTNNFPVAFTTASSNASSNDLSQGYTVCLRGQSVVTSGSDPSLVTSLASNIYAVNCANINDSQLPHYDSSVTNYYYLQLSYNGSVVSGASSYSYNLIRNDGLFMHTSSTCSNIGGSYLCPAQISLTAVQTALGGLVLGPQTQQLWLPNFNFANPKHEPRFDPYCADQDGDGYCDCQRDTAGDGTYATHLGKTTTPPASACTFADRPGQEPTSSDAPVMSGSPDQSLFWYLNTACGNLGGTALAQCLTTQANLGHNYQHLTSVNWQNLFVCQTPTPGQKLTFVDFMGVTQNPSQAGGNCGANHTSGPVSMPQIARRLNAFDIAQPQTTLQLLATAMARQTSGATVQPTDALFSYQEALALAFFRFAVPLDNIQVYGPDLSQASVDYTSSSNLVLYPGVQTTLQQINLPNSNTADPASALLREILHKAQIL